MSKSYTQGLESTFHKCLIDQCGLSAFFSLKQKKIVCFQLTTSACSFSSQEQRMHALQARVGAGEQALAALEQTATEQMEGLTQQSSHALERVQRQLGQAYSQLEQLHSFIKVLCKRIRD